MLPEDKGMKEKTLKNLNRSELLELLLVQTKENERLKAELEKTTAELNSKYLDIQEAGSLAGAVIKINGVMEAVEGAARQYLANIAKMEEKTRQKCKEMLEAAEKEAELIRSGKKEEPVLPAENVTENKEETIG